MKREVKNIDDRVKRAERWMIGLTIAIAFFALCSVVVGVFQWQVMSGQLHEMRSGSGQTDQLIAKTGTLASNAGTQAARTKDLADRMKDQADRTKIIAEQAVISADAAKNAAVTSEKAMTVGNRPWVKITHKIVQPLSFGLPPTTPADVVTFAFIGAKEPVARMMVEDTFENVGQTIALDVISWEDVFPEDYEIPPGGGPAIPTAKSALARQNDWCGTNRNSEQSRQSGTILFPHTPVTQISGMAAPMSKVNEAAGKSPIRGKASFVMVGCIGYRSSFEDLKAPNHQIRFIYHLGSQQASGGWYGFVEPRGIASDLTLIKAFDTFTSD